MASNTKSLSIRRWAQLSEEQLIFIFSCDGGDVERKVKIFMYLMGLKVATEDFLRDLVAGIDSSMSMDDIGDVATAIEDIISNRKMVLKTADGDYWFVDSLNLCEGAVSSLEWLQKEHSLLVLPMKNVMVGKHIYRMPSALMMNERYQQFLNSQNFLEMYWRAVESVTPEDEDEPGKIEKVDENKLKEAAEKMDKAVRGFLASLLVPYKRKVRTTYPFLYKDAEYACADEGEVMEEMRNAPSWLFECLYKWYQDTQLFYSKKFRKMFRKHSAPRIKGKGNEDAWVAELGTVNLIKEKGNFPSIDAVMKAPVPYVMKLLDDIQKEQEELRKLEKKK